MKQPTGTHWRVWGVLAAVALMSVFVFISCMGQSIAQPPHDYRFQKNNSILYAVSEPGGENPHLADYRFSLYQNGQQQGKDLAFRADTRLPTSDTQNFSQWWQSGEVQGVLSGTAATLQVGTIELALDFTSGSLQHTRAYTKEMLDNLLASNPAGDKEIYEIRYPQKADAPAVHSEIVLHNTQTGQIFYLMNGSFLGRIQFDGTDTVIAATLSGIRCFDGTTGQLIQPSFAPFNGNSHYNYQLVDFLYDPQNQVYITAWAYTGNVQKDRRQKITVTVVSAGNHLFSEYPTQHQLPDAQMFGSSWPRLTLDATGLKLEAEQQVMLSLSQAEYLESVHDYTFTDGSYTLLCKEAPHEEDGIAYQFSLCQNGRQIGKTLTFYSDTTTTSNYDTWWAEGLVEGDVNGNTATVRVGFFKLELDFQTNRLKHSRDYQREMLGKLLASNPTGDKQLYPIVYDQALNPNLSRLTNDIVVYDTKTEQIHYLFDGFALDQILFDDQDNILACTAGGILCFDADSYREKELPFAFSRPPGSYDFIDFVYDSRLRRYILGWAEAYRRVESIPEETAALEGVPPMQVSVFSADGALLGQYDTGHILPPFKTFDEKHWPRLKLNDTGLELSASFIDGRERVFFALPYAQYASGLSEKE